MTNNIIKQVEDLIESGICEPSRLYHILDMLKKGKPLFNSDKAYLDRMHQKLEEKVASLQQENKTINNTLENQKLGIVDGIDLDKLLDETKNHTLISDKEIDNILDQQKTKKRTSSSFDPNHIKEKSNKKSFQNKIKGIFSKN